jgi:3-dehydrosphinganine reductase
MPVTMFTPGYEEENKSKPALTLKIEESDGGLTAEKAAEGLYEGAVHPSFLTAGLIANIYTGIKKGDFHIMDTFIADLFQTSTCGTLPFGSNVLKDLLLGVIGTVRFHTYSRTNRGLM